MAISNVEFHLDIAKMRGIYLVIDHGAVFQKIDGVMSKSEGLLGSQAL